MTASARQILTFGGTGGDSFPMTVPNSIGLRSGDMVNALIMNGVQHGANGGNSTPELVLGQTEYWADVTVAAGGGIDGLTFKSNLGRVVGGGTPGGSGSSTTSMTGLRVLLIGGSAGDRLEQIKIELISDYIGSTVVDSAGMAVLDFQPGGQTITTYSDQIQSTSQAYSKTTESIVQLTVNASAEGEYYAKFTASTGLTTTDSTMQTIQSAISDTLRTDKKTVQVLGPSQAAFLVSSVTIMQDSDQKVWMFPNAAPNWLVLDSSTFDNLVGFYNLTSGAAIQAGLSDVASNGYRKLQKKP